MNQIKDVRYMARKVQARSAWPGDPAIAAFHRSLPGYRPTPLHDAPTLAGLLGVGRVFVKDETTRMGLPAFKVLGASWAARRALARYDGSEPATLVTATDGNHGRAVARVARWLGVTAEIFVPEDMAAQRVRAIAAEGASVVHVRGSYDDAVRAAGSSAGGARLVLADTGEDNSARDVIDGYSTVAVEIAAQLPADAAVTDAYVQMGVGSFAASMINFLPGALGRELTFAGVEPISAACVLASLAADRPVTVPGPHSSIMAGLNCGEVSPVAWPILRDGLDLAVAIEDTRLPAALRVLHEAGIPAGESGAAGLAGALAVQELLPALYRLGDEDHLLLIVTEGVTDPATTSALLANDG